MSNATYKLRVNYSSALLPLNSARNVSDGRRWVPRQESPCDERFIAVRRNVQSKNPRSPILDT